MEPRHETQVPCAETPFSARQHDDCMMVGDHYAVGASCHSHRDVEGMSWVVFACADLVWIKSPTVANKHLQAVDHSNYQSMKNVASYDKRCESQDTPSTWTSNAHCGFRFIPKSHLFESWEDSICNYTFKIGRGPMPMMYSGYNTMDWNGDGSVSVRRYL